MIGQYWVARVRYTSDWSETRAGILREDEDDHPDRYLLWIPDTGSTFVVWSDDLIAPVIEPCDDNA